MTEAAGILLEHGLDPNRIIEYSDGGQTNIMSELHWIRNGYQAADTVLEMFKHGGDPCIMIEGERLIRFLDSELFFMFSNEEFRYSFDSYVHYWMAFIGFGAKLENGRSPVVPAADFDASAFRDHRRFCYRMISSDCGSELCFFENESGREVARI